MGDFVQYSVILMEGVDKDLKRWVWVGGERFRDVVKRCGGARVYYNVSRLEVCDGRLSIVARDERSANVLASLRGLPEPFIEVGGGYVFNRHGESF